MKKNLIISVVGDESLHNNWIPDTGSTYDLYLIYYGNKEGYEKDAKIHIKKKGSKFNLISDLLEQRPEILKYSYIWIPDDDIFLEKEEVEKLFYLAELNDLWICQPSIMGWYGLSVTLNHCDSHLRFTNYVEIMCPCFSSYALNKCRTTFNENKSGWGIDAVWNVILGHPKDKIAIIDDVIAVHTRRIGGGDIYKNQTGDMKNALEEAVEIYKKYNLADENYEDLKYGKCVSQESFFKLYFNTMEYRKIYKSMEAGVDVKYRIWPDCNLIKKLCEDVRVKKKKFLI